MHSLNNRRDEDVALYSRVQDQAVASAAAQAQPPCLLGGVQQAPVELLLPVYDDVSKPGLHAYLQGQRCWHL